MTAMNVFEHHKFLMVVAEEDVRFVLEKDRSYGASWKKSGGRSAWFMLKRKIDRMIEMMKDPAWPESFSLEDLSDAANKHTIGETECALTPELAGWLVEKLTAEDIFTKIEAAPSGDDGTVLAEVRDLRRYLLLVEAEMMARGVVALSACALTAVPCHVEIVVEELTMKTTTETQSEPRVGDYIGMKDLRDVSPPWSIDAVWKTSIRNTMSEPVINEWYRMMGAENWVLEPFVSKVYSECVPTELNNLFTYVSHEGLLSAGWLVNINQCPKDLRSWFPVLNREVNDSELKGMEMTYPWVKALYDKITGENKLRLRPEYAAWSFDANDE
jgi:hypothetical protein